MWKFSASRTLCAGMRVGRSSWATWRLGVDAGIGAAGDDAGDGLPRFSFAAAVSSTCLHREPGRLALPADERGAVVFQQQGPAGVAIRRCRRAGEILSGLPPASSPLLAASSPQCRPGRHGMAAQERVRRHRRPAGQLHAGQPQRLGAAGDGQPIVQHRARCAGAVGQLAASTFSIAPPSVVNVPGQGSNARTCRSIAAASLRPVDPASPRASASARRSRPSVRLRHRRGMLGQGAQDQPRAQSPPARRAASAAVVVSA